MEKLVEQKRILVAEDDEAMARVIAHWFTLANFDVQLADNGIVAWNYLEQNRADLVITDYSMTLVSGSQLCEMMRADSRYRHMPIVLITGRCRELDLAWMQKEYQIAHVLKKPFSMPLLVDVVKSVLATPALP